MYNRCLAIRCALALFLLLMTCCSPSSEKQVVNITKSEADINEYRYVEFNNGLKAMLVHYPNSEQAAAALTVGVGSYDDPITRTGLAHYLEHMLFLGTKKYPDAEEYHRFISQNGGATNAFTSSDHTTYMFEINAQELQPALDRFSHFFIDPTFDEKYVDRERHAVDSEYRMHVKNDSMRVFHALKKVLNPKHPISKFNIGSLDTLSNENGSLRKEVMEFYNENYEPNNMFLAIVGPQPLSELEQYAKEMFSVIPYKVSNNIVAAPLPPVMTKNEIGKEINIETLAESDSLSMIFHIPNQKKEYKDIPTDYIEYMLQQSNNGSLFNKLKNDNLISELSASISNIALSDALLEIEFTLTKHGTNHIPRIISDTFSYIEWLKSDGVHKWIYDQLKKINIRAFRFEQRLKPRKFATEISERLMYYPAKDVLSYEYLTAESKFPEKKIKNLLNALSAENMIVIRTGANIPTNKEEEYFNTKYKVTSLNNTDMLSEINKTYNKWSLPEKNTFLPEDFTILASDTNSEFPHLVVDKNNFQAWILSLPQFQVPKQELRLKLKTNYIGQSVKTFVMTALYNTIVKDNMTKYATMLSSAEIELDSETQQDGIVISVTGYRDNLSKALELYLTHIVNGEVSADRFKSIKELFIDELNDNKNEKAYKQVMEENDLLLMKNSYTASEKLDAFKGVTYNDFVAFSKKLISSISKADLIVEGNVNEDDANSYVSIVESIVKFNDKPYTFKLENVAIPDTDKLWEVHLANKETHSLSVYYPIEGKSNLERAKVLLLANIIDVPLYDELRTNQQVGYVVLSKYNRVYEKIGLHVVIESPKYTQTDLLHRLGDFFKEEYKVIEGMSDDEFIKYKASIKQALTEKPKDIDGSISLHWSVLNEGFNDFDRNNLVAEAINDISKDEILNVYKTLFLDKTPRIIVSNDNNDLKNIDRLPSIRGLN